jgi:twinfilin-like protein
LVVVFFGLQHIDFEKELIKLSSTEPTDVKELPRRISKDCARYHFFLYKHSHEGDYLESTGEYRGLRSWGN